MRAILLSAAMALPLTLAAATMAAASPDNKQPADTIKVSAAQPAEVNRSEQVPISRQPSRSKVL